MKKQLSICILFLVCILTANAQKAKTIFFKKPLHTKPLSGFYIDTVFDERPDTYKLGYIQNASNKETGLNIQNGLDAAIYQLAQLYTHKDNKASAISLHITQLAIVVKTVALRKHADIKATYAFYYNNKKLIEYAGSAYLEAIDDIETIVNQLLEKNVQGSLQKFGTWFAENKDQGIIDPTISVLAEIRSQVDDTDYIPFSLSRPLSFDDFKGPADDLSSAAAITYSGMQYSFSTDEQLGKLLIHVYLTPYFDRYRSWTRVTTSHAYALSHEQTHFNITAAITCQLLKKIREYHFSVDNYKKEIEALIKQANKDMLQLQADYDKETKHSLIHDQQEKWNKKITKMLQDGACYSN